MFSTFHFKFPKKQISSPRKQQKDVSSKQRHKNQRLLSLKYRKQLKNENNPKQQSLREIEEWIFDDQKITAQHYRLMNRKPSVSLQKPSNYSRIQKSNEKYSKNNFKAQLIKSQANNQIIFQTSSLKKSQIVRIPPSLTRQQILQQAILNKQTSKNLKVKQMVRPRSTTSSNSGIREKQKAKPNMRMYFNLNVFMKKGESPVKLKKTSSFSEQKISTFRQTQMEQKNWKVRRSNSEITQIKKERDKATEKYGSLTMSIPSRKLQQKIQTDRQIFEINPWQVHSPLSPDLFGIHRYEYKNLELVPIPSEAECDYIT